MIKVPVICIDGLPVHTQPGLEGNNALPRQRPSTLTQIAAVNSCVAVEAIATRQAPRAAGDPPSGFDADDSEAEPEPEPKDAATKKRNSAEANKIKRKVAWQKKSKAAKAALPK